MGEPFSSFCVWALNALQNSMMLRPRWPSAGPIGGDGLAAPAGTCNFREPVTFFAMSHSLRRRLGRLVGACAGFVVRTGALGGRAKSPSTTIEQLARMIRLQSIAASLIEPDD